jgi:ribosomal protein S18 acetylase RimI-like enzyme
MAIAPPASQRLASSADAAALALVGSATFLESYAGILPVADILAHCERQHSPALYAQWLADRRNDTWLVEAEAGGAPVGYAVLAPAAVPVADPHPADLEVKRIYLLHRFQGAGWGRRMMDAAAQRARERGSQRLLLGVYSRNHAALAFYARLGFSRAGERSFRVGASDYFDYLLALPL